MRIEIEIGKWIHESLKKLYALPPFEAYSASKMVFELMQNRHDEVHCDDWIKEDEEWDKEKGQWVKKAEGAEKSDAHES